MITTADLDQRITHVDAWVPQAAEALSTLWHGPVLIPDSRPGWPEILDEESELTKTAVRALWALADYLRWAEEAKRRGDTPGPTEEVASKVYDLANRWFVALDRQRAQKETDRPSLPARAQVLDDSYLLSSLALLDALHHSIGVAFGADAVTDMHRYGCRVAADLLERLSELGPRRAERADPAPASYTDDESGPIDDFVALHAVRALDSFRERVPQDLWAELGPTRLEGVWQPLARRAREDVLRHLGYLKAELPSSFDAAELAFSAILLGRVSQADSTDVTQPALRAVLASQTADGAWPTIKLADTPSLEVALALLAHMSRDVAQGNLEFAGDTLQALDRSLDLVVSTHTVTSDLRGWPNDRDRARGLIARWPTARVLSFTVRYSDALRALRQRLILAQYRAHIPEVQTQWPDLEPTYRVPPALNDDGLRTFSDPTAHQQLTRTLSAKVLGPIVRDPVQRPQMASLILHGPPGTRKTSLIREISNALDWPLLTLSPPTFLSRGGLDGFEAAADAVFDDLLRLRRVVVLFDECEEFFLRREPANADSLASPQVADTGPVVPPAEMSTETASSAQQQGSEVNTSTTLTAASPQSRTVGAFITAGMLPRLQALRDERWVLFALATNKGLAGLDEAVIRPGRFDYAVLIDHPVLDAQRRYIEAKQLGDAATAALLTALESFDKLAAEADPSVSFAALDSIAKQFDAEAAQADSVVTELKRLLHHAGPRPLLTETRGHLPFKVTLDDTPCHDQNEEVFSIVNADCTTQRLRLHDYPAIYAIPGLYEEVVQHQLQCQSPRKIRESVSRAAAAAGKDMTGLRALDLGAGNGVVGELLREHGIATPLATDSIPQAREAAHRDRPGLYKEYLIGGTNTLPLASRIETMRLNCLVCVAALGYEHIAAADFAQLWGAFPAGSIFAITVKTELLAEDKASAIGNYLNSCKDAPETNIIVWDDFDHRLSMAGGWLRYTAIAALKVPSA